MWSLTSHVGIQRCWLKEGLWEVDEQTPLATALVLEGPGMGTKHRMAGSYEDVWWRKGPGIGSQSVPPEIFSWVKIFSRNIFLILFTGRSTDWSPSLVGGTPWSLSASRPGWAAGCSRRFSSAVPERTEINRNMREQRPTTPDNRMVDNLTKSGIDLKSLQFPHELLSFPLVA